MSACRVASPVRPQADSLCVHRCSQRQVSNPQTSVTVPDIKNNFSSHKNPFIACRTFRIKIQDNCIHRRPAVFLYRANRDFCPWEMYEVMSGFLFFWLLLSLIIFYDRAGKRGGSFHRDNPQCAIFFQSSTTDPWQDLHSLAHPFGPSFSSASPSQK